MPRIARVVIPGCPHHITQRGNRREQVFYDDADHAVFLELLGTYAATHKLRIDGYCLMPNHVHLVARPHTEESLGRTLKPVFVRYTQHMNARRQLSGRLWQGRFFSCPLDEDHFWTALRYVERNPVRAGMRRRAETHPWSSAAAHCGVRTDPLLADPERLMAQVSDWSAWLQDAEPRAKVTLLRRRTHAGRPAGSDGFVRRLQKRLGRVLEARPAGRPKKAEGGK